MPAVSQSPLHPQMQRIMTTHKTHKFWLKLMASGIVLYALFFFLGTLKQTASITEVVMDISSWPMDGLQNLAANSTVFLSALLGGILFGWGVLIWILSGTIYDKAPEEIRKAVLFSAISWFVVDSVGSVLSGNAYNAFANTILLLVLVGPLWRRVEG